MIGPTKCAKCSGDMQAGFVLESGLLSDPRPKWVSGPVEVNFAGGVNIAERDVRRMVTFRCLRCGYLESYATDPR